MAEDSVKNSYCFYSVLLWSITNSDARCYGKRSGSFQPPHTFSLEPAESVLWWWSDVAKSCARPGCFLHPSSISEYSLMGMDGLMPPPEAPASLGGLSPRALLACPTRMSLTAWEREIHSLSQPMGEYRAPGLLCASCHQYMLMRPPGKYRTPAGLFYCCLLVLKNLRFHMKPVVTLTKRCHMRNKSRMQVKLIQVMDVKSTPGEKIQLFPLYSKTKEVLVRWLQLGTRYTGLWN